MTANELKDALLKRYKVKYNGIIYDCVSGIIYRAKGDRIEVSVELLDREHNSITVCNSMKVEKANAD